MTTPGPDASSQGTESSTQARASAPQETAADPVAVPIPAIGVAGDLIGLGLTDDGSLEVPSDADQLGWFTGGSGPGQSDPTVVAGHVDSEQGPAVFHRLPEVEPGDRIEAEPAPSRITALHHDVGLDPICLPVGSELLTTMNIGRSPKIIAEETTYTPRHSRGAPTALQVKRCSS